MLTLTGHAVDAIRSLTANPELPADTGLRIEPAGGDGSLKLSLSEGPQAGDEVIAAEDIVVFVQHDAASLLADQALDAQVTDQGAVSFVLSRQAG